VCCYTHITNNNNKGLPMRSIFYSVLARVLPTNAVDRAVRGLVRAADALAVAEAAQVSRVGSINTRIEALREERAAALAVAARSARIRERLAGLTA
jgi:hypothetical protein